MSELVALNWGHVNLDADPAELYLPGGIQTVAQLQRDTLGHHRDRDVRQDPTLEPIDRLIV